MTQEEARLAANRDSLRDRSASRTAYWKRWGPYLSERQWGRVRFMRNPGLGVYPKLSSCQLG